MYLSYTYITEDRKNKLIISGVDEMSLIVNQSMQSNATTCHTVTVPEQQTINYCAETRLSARIKTFGRRV